MKIPPFIRNMVISMLILLVILNQEPHLEEDTAFAETIPVEAIAVEHVEKSTLKEEWAGNFLVAAYCGCEDCIGESKTPKNHFGGVLESGQSVAADLSVFHLGELLKIGDNVYRVEDKVTSGSQEVLRIYFDDHEQAIQFGRKNLPVYRIHEEKARGENFWGIFQVTGYCSCEICCGDNRQEVVTKTGTVPQINHTIAVDPEVIPLGTKVMIDGIVYTAEDTGSMVKGNVIDIFFATHQQALDFGRQEKEVYRVE